MSILEYSVAKKIYTNLLGITPAPNEVGIISKEVTIDYTDVSGASFEINLGELPEGSVLLHSQVDVSVPFTDGNIHPFFSLGLSTQEESSIEYPVTYDFRELIFDQLRLNNVGIIDSQGELTDADVDKTLNKTLNGMNVLFKMTGSWGSGGNLNLARRLLGGCGNHNAALCMGGIIGSPQNQTEEYGGASWSVGGALGTSRRYIKGAGIQDAALCTGGHTGSVIGTTEEYNGASWSAGGALNTSRYAHATSGLQSAALVVSGYTTVAISSSEEYNGASWTSSNDCNAPRYSSDSAGTQDSSILIGGTTGGTSGGLSSCEEYNGTTWSVTNNLNVAQAYGASFGLSSYEATTCGGYDTSAAQLSSTEEFDGTNWTVSNDLNSSVDGNACAGSQTSGLSTGGWNGSTDTATTEEYTQNSLSDLTQGSLTLFVTYTHV